VCVSVSEMAASATEVSHCRRRFVVLYYSARLKCQLSGSDDRMSLKTSFNTYVAHAVVAQRRDGSINVWRTCYMPCVIWTVTASHVVGRALSIGIR